MRWVSAVLALGLFVGVLTAETASAFDPLPPPPKVPKVTGATIAVKVTGTGVVGGKPGRTTTRSVRVRTPCMMVRGDTGKAYYEWVKSGRAYFEWRHTGGEGPYVPKPNYEKYKDDTTGHWYGGMCDSTGFEDMKAFFAIVDKYFAEHESVYVRAGTAIPIPPIPPELLREAAIDAMTLPAPAIDWNPKRSGDRATVVRLDTWVWLTDRRDALWVEASVDSLAGRMSARVDATLTGLRVSAPGAVSTECAGPGVPYARGATGECSIRFTQTSAALGLTTTPVTVQSQWHATWLSNGQPQGDVPEQPTVPPQVTNVGVGEFRTFNR